MKQLTTFILLTIVMLSAKAQSTCEVAVPALKGTYTGACDNNKAQGEGKAIGEDTYEGTFKKGYPDGIGVYTWKNGDIYTGAFKKGLKEGKGTLVKKSDSANGKTLTGFWKKDNYFGEYEAAFKIYSMTTDVSRAKVENVSQKSISGSIKVVIENTSSKMATDRGEILPQLKLTNIQVTKGTFSQRLDTEKYKNEETVFTDVEFPFRAIFYIDNNAVEAEFFVPGNYILNIFLNK